MRSQHLGRPAATHALAFEVGDEVADGLLRFAEKHGIQAARFSAIGALSEATLAFFDLEEKAYQEIPVEEQTEVLVLTGTLARFDGDPRLHAHAVLGRADGSAVGGHFVRGLVQPTLEVVLDVFDATLERATDPVTGLALLDL